MEPIKDIKDTKIKVPEPGIIIWRYPGDKVASAFYYGRELKMNHNIAVPREQVFSRQSWEDVFGKGKREGYDIITITWGGKEATQPGEQPIPPVEAMTTLIDGFEIDRLLSLSQQTNNKPT